jgi:AcrR family transcriptional regulator
VETLKAKSFDDVRRGGRPAAGTDPKKRRQILDGAGRIFSTLGFDAASMNDVALEARVSKATLYVYFEDKEHLFAALCAERRDRNIAELIAHLDTQKPLATVLNEFAKDVARRISSPGVIASQRVVIGVAERMPELGREFFEAGAIRLSRALEAFIAVHVARGVLRVDDPFLAAAQFLELAQASLFRSRLYGYAAEPPGEEEVEKVASSAVRVFLAAYGSGSNLTY